MSTAQLVSSTVTSISPYVRVAELVGKGRGMVATRDIPKGTLLWSEQPLTSSPFPTSSASQVTPQSAVDELAIELLADPAGAYRLLCHHVELQHDSSPSTTPADHSSAEVELGVSVSGVSGVTMRRSPVAEWSDLQFSIAASQVQSNAFDTHITAAEVEAIRRLIQQRRRDTAAVAAEMSQPTAEGESEQSREEDDDTLIADSASSKSKKNAKKRAKRKAKQLSHATTTTTSATQPQRLLTLYVHISMLNHCCYPNTQVYWPAGAASDGLQSPRVYSISDVKAGDELCISYRTDLLHYPTQLRQSVINSSWHFHCACDRCTRPDHFPHDVELLGLTQPLTDEQQSRMLQSFTSLLSYAEQLSATADSEVVLHPRMLRQLFDFFALPLSTAHWRRHRLRSLYLPLLLAQSSVSYVDKRRVLDEHIGSNTTILPPLHASKLQYLLTFVQLLELEESGRTGEDWMKELTALEPHADDIMRMYK